MLSVVTATAPENYKLNEIHPKLVYIVVFNVVILHCVF